MLRARWALWPSSIVVNLDGFPLFYMVVYALPGYFFSKGLEVCFALWQDFQGQPRPVLTIVADHPDLLFNANNRLSGLVLSDGTLYDMVATTTAGVGKVDPASAQDRSAWSFDAGSGPRKLVTPFRFSTTRILSVSWNAFLQRYLAVYSPPFSQRGDATFVRRPLVKRNRGVRRDAPSVATSTTRLIQYDSNSGQTIYVSYSRCILLQ